MLFEAKVAARYLRSGGVQSLLVGLGVAVGIVAFTFIAALINGLEISLTNDVIGNLAHVTLEPPEQVPKLLEEIDGREALVSVQRSNDRRQEIEGWRPIFERLLREPDVVSVAPSVTGSGFARRGEKVQPLTIIGNLPQTGSAIVDLEGNVVRGAYELGSEDVLVGVELARELGLEVGQRMRVSSDRGRERVLRVRGVFDLESGSLNERVAYVDLNTAQSLFDLEGSVSRFELKVQDIYDAPRVADRLQAITALEAKDWIEENARLQSALRAQGSTGTLIKIFSLAAILVGVASTLLLAAVRRRAEIGILRSFGVSKRQVSAIFVLQGLGVGLAGSVVGALGGWSFCWLLLKLTLGPDGEPALPVEPAAGEYGRAIVLATVASVIAAILPARAAANVDPVEVIQN